MISSIQENRVYSYIQVVDNQIWSHLHMLELESKEGGRGNIFFARNSLCFQLLAAIALFMQLFIFQIVE